MKKTNRPLNIVSDNLVLIMFFQPFLFAVCVASMVVQASGGHRVASIKSTDLATQLLIIQNFAN